MSVLPPEGASSPHAVRSPTPQPLHRQGGRLRVPSSHLKRQILGPAAMVLLFMALMFLVGAGQYLRSLERQRTVGAAEQAQRLWRRLAQEEDRKLSWFVSEALSREDLAQAMQKGDRDALLKATQAQLEAMRQHFGVTHWYFITPDQHVLLRVHAPGRNGDLIARHSLQEAVRTGEPASGLELGAMSTFTLRHVAPWRVNGHLIGYIEMGAEVEWFAREISRVVNVQVMTAVRKSATSAEQFQQGKAALGLTGRWGDDPDLALLNQTMAILPDGLMPAWREWQAQGAAGHVVKELAQEDLRWSVSFVPMTDSRGQQLASMALLRDVAPERAEAMSQLLALGLASVSMMGLLFCTLYLRVATAEGELRGADEALRSNERRFSDFASATSDWWFWELDANLCFSYVSPGVEQNLGFPERGMLGLPLSELALNQDAAEREVWRVHLEEMAQHKPITQFESRITLPNGEVRWSSVSGTPVFDGHQFIGYRGTGCNITARRQAEEAQRLAATAFESLEGMIVMDVHGVILRVNKAFSDITGFSAEEAVGRHPNMLAPSAQSHALFETIRADLHRTGRWQGEWWSLRKNGEVYPQWLTVTVVRGVDGQLTHCVGAFSDISERKAAEAEIERLAFFDPLTGLPNRRLLMDRLKLAQATSRRHGHAGALLLIDLDNFKTLNDTLGHDKGDLLLRQITERLQPCLRAADTLARLGGDEFVVVLAELSANEREAAMQARHVADKLLQTLSHVYDLEGSEYHCTCSIGVTLFGAEEVTLEELMKRADLAMYEGKAGGRNTVRFFDPAMQTEVTKRAALEADLRKALQRHEFELYYQAQVDDDGRLQGAEALVRWRHPEQGMVSPAVFIPAAEQTGQILPLGQWVLETACRQLVAWQKVPTMAHLTVAVNVSARQFRQQDFADQVLKVLSMTGAEPRQLKLELTESLLLDNLDDTIEKMTTLQKHGVSFALDDFGTGYSSLSYLKRLPLNQLKIDQSFVRNVLTEPNDAAIVRSIVGLARSLGLMVIAEGVETEDQRAFLVEHGCANHQGYLFGRPLPASDFERTYLMA